MPCERETLTDLQRRRAQMISAVAHGKSYDGIAVHRGDPEVQLVLKALHEAINRRLRAEPVAYKIRPTQRKETGKTARDKAKKNYKAPDVRKKEKSERDAQIRREAQGTKGKQ
jgi:hypothetical protein